MVATTVLTPDTATTVISDEYAPPSRFSWPAAFAGSIAAAAIIFLLLTLGAGVGLSLTTAPALVHGQAPTFLTLGAIYFLAAQTFGFAVGGYIAGRLVGYLPEPDKEEEFRSSAHGLVVWGIGVVATATMIAFSVLPLAGAATGAAAVSAASASDDTRLTPLTTGYWVDVLFRAPNATRQAALGWKQYAQNNTTGTDAAPAGDASTSTDDESDTPVQQDAPAAATNATGTLPSGTPDQSVTTTTGGSTMVQPSGTALSTGPLATTPVNGRSIAADKGEAGRILDVGMANGDKLTVQDRDQLAYLVAQDTGVAANEASRRVNYVQSRIRNTETQATETARIIARNASLWIALALLFGAIVAVFSAIAARHLDDRVTFGAE